jgi:hypothetical protein
MKRLAQDLAIVRSKIRTACWRTWIANALRAEAAL